MTPSNSNNIDRIRQLIAAWYAGSATASDEAELTTRLSAADNLPSDLEADKRIILAIKAQKSAAVPDDLEDKILEATCGHERQRSKFLVYLTRCAAAAACAAAIVGAFITINRADEDIAVPATTPASKIYAKVDTIAAPAEIVQQDEPQAAIAKAEPKRRAAAVQAPQDEEIAEPNIYIVTDSMEALYIAQQVMEMLDNSIGESSRQLASAERAINSSIKCISYVDHIINFEQ